MRVTSLLLVGALAPGIAVAEPSKEARAFGAREAIVDISLAPDASKVAVVRPLGNRGYELAVSDFATGRTKVILQATRDGERLSGCRWTTATRLVCGLSIAVPDGERTFGFSRLLALDADGSKLKMLSEQGSSFRALRVLQYGGSVIDWTGNGQGGAVLMMRDHVPESTNGTRLAKTRSGVGVDLVDTVTLARRAVEPPASTAVEYISDGAGTVRVIGRRGSTSAGYADDRIAYSYRRAGDRDWQALSQLDFAGVRARGFDPHAVDPALNTVYGFDDVDGRRALVKVALDGSLRKEVVVARPDVDVEGLIRIGRQDRVVGASWTGDSGNFVFFDPELAQLSAALGRAMPARPAVRFTDASVDEKHLLLSASSDDHAGTYYLYDKSTRKLEEVLPARPQLAGIALGKMKPITYRAADGTTIPGYLTLPAGSSGKGLPAIVLPHGGPASRDEWGFDWLAQFFAARGFAVLQPNFRGSSGYGEAWFQKNGFQSWRTAVGDINDGGRWLLAQGIAAPGKLAVVGWSYGGYAALQSSALDPALFKAIVAIAPVTDLATLREEARGYANFPMVDRLIGTGPHVREGSPAQRAATIAAPVLLFHGDRDSNVGVGESRLMANRLRAAGKPVEYVEYKGLDHQLNDSQVRAEMLDKSDAFLRASLGL